LTAEALTLRVIVTTAGIGGVSDDMTEEGARLSSAMAVRAHTSVGGEGVSASTCRVAGAVITNAHTVSGVTFTTTTHVAQVAIALAVVAVAISIVVTIVVMMILHLDVLVGSPWCQLIEGLRLRHTIVTEADLLGNAVLGAAGEHA